MNYEADLDELDRIWPLGKQLIVPDGGTVLIAGAYEGRYADYICSRFKPGKVIGFEPQIEKMIIAEERLRRHAPITKLYGVGLGVHDCMVMMDDIGTDGCKVCKDGTGNAMRLEGIDSVIDRYGPFDLFICNMEGYEIPLIGYLMASGLIRKFTSIAVQFHNKLKDGQCATMLEESYGWPLYNDYPTWMYFKLPFTT